jgi:dethiobiotin synthetase
MRPRRLVLVVGTGTDIGKTWVSARLLEHLRASGTSVAARKPAQSFDPDDDPAGFDAAILGAATGEAAEIVCLPHRWYPTAMAPPMASASLGRRPFTITELAHEIEWPADGVDVGLVETAGGVGSPQAEDGDAVSLCSVLAPDLVVLVADAGLGTINSVRLTVGVLHGWPLVVVLNRYEDGDELHRRNREWLTTREGLKVKVMPQDLHVLCAIITEGEGSGSASQ